MCAAVCTLLAAAVGAPLCGAQSTEEIIVYASKRPDEARRQPVAASVVTAQELAVSGTRNLAEMQSLVPGLSLNRATSSNSVAFGIRGNATNSVNAALEPSVGLYVDGVPRARQGAMINDLVDVRRVEVLKGPQGTLFGRNTPAGAVSVVTVAPDDDSGFVQFGAGSDDNREASGALTLRAIDEVLAFRVAATGARGDGTVDDVALGTAALNDRDRWGARVQALYTPREHIALRVIADASGLDEHCCAVGSWLNNVEAQRLPEGTAPKPGTDARVLALGGTVLPQQDFYDRVTSLSELSRSSNDEAGLSAQFDMDLGESRLASISAYREYSLDDAGDADFTDLDVLLGRYELDQSQWSQEFRLSGVDDTLDYVAGLFWFHNQVDSESSVIAGADTGALLGLPTAALPAGSAATTRASQDNTAVAVFGQAEVALAPELSLTVGARWTREEKQLRNRFREDASAQPDFQSPGWGFWLLPSLAPRSDVDEQLDDSEWTGTLKLAWTPSHNALWYLSWASGYKAGGINTSRIDERLDPVFDAEHTQSWEAGVKLEVPAADLALGIAAHLTDTDDLQLESFQGVDFTLQNAGQSRTYGGELDAVWQPLASLRLSLSYAYTHSELRDFRNGPCWVATPWHTDRPDPGSNGDGSCDRSGGVLPDNAEHQGVFTGQWTMRLARAWQARLYAQYSYTDRRMTALNNDPLKADGSFGLVNLRAALVYEPWRTTLTAWGRNVTDAHYTPQVQDAPLQEGRLVAVYGEPRTWGLTVRREF